MKRYKLLKDLPYARAGEVFERNTHKSKDGLSDYDYLEIKKRVKVGEDEVRFGIKYNHFLDNFDEWFEEIQGPTDSIHWKPVIGEEYWSFHSDGGISHNFCTGCYWDTARYKMGRTYRTKEECIRARNRKLAEVRLRRTSNFEPDFLNDNGGWVVYYDPREKRLEVQEVYRLEYGELVRYETEEDAQKSIKENREDWLTYFGIEEEK
jgi:hypothetical protein|nr:MAG TPA: hypothetical protein [Caudoviricetes sp.]